jgi:hypothetical protein
MKCFGPLTDYVSERRKGNNSPTSHVQAWCILRETYEASGMTVTLGTHTMRKTFANKVYTALTGDLLKTQRALGHRRRDSSVEHLSFKVISPGSTCRCKTQPSKVKGVRA